MTGGKPAGAIVELAPYDWTGDGTGPDVGDVVATDGGSAYRVLDAQLYGSIPNRYRLRCEKLAGISSIPAVARVFRLAWYPRRRRRVLG